MPLLRSLILFRRTFYKYAAPTALGMPPRAMTAQFSNSNGGIGRAVSPLTAAGCQWVRSYSPRRRARSDAPYHALCTTKPRLARQSIRFPAGANVAQALGHDAQAWAKYQGSSHARIFKVTVDASPTPWGEGRVKGERDSNFLCYLVNANSYGGFNISKQRNYGSIIW
jgi:hypothetical protein